MGYSPVQGASCPGICAHVNVHLIDLGAGVTSQYTAEGGQSRAQIRVNTITCPKVSLEGTWQSVTQSVLRGSNRGGLKASFLTIDSSMPAQMEQRQAFQAAVGSYTPGDDRGQGHQQRPIAAEPKTKKSYARSSKRGGAPVFCQVSHLAVLLLSCSLTCPIPGCCNGGDGTKLAALPAGENASVKLAFGAVHIRSGGHHLVRQH